MLLPTTLIDTSKRGFDLSIKKRRLIKLYRIVPVVDHIQYRTVYHGANQIT